MASYKLSGLARQDLVKITRYTAQTWGERQAAEYPEQIKTGAQFVANFPSWGKIYSTRRGAVYQRHRVGEHFIFYRPTTDGILIVRILYCRMDFDRHL